MLGGAATTQIKVGYGALHERVTTKIGATKTQNPCLGTTAPTSFSTPIRRTRTPGRSRGLFLAGNLSRLILANCAVLMDGGSIAGSSRTSRATVRGIPHTFTWKGSIQTLATF